MIRDFTRGTIFSTHILAIAINGCQLYPDDLHMVDSSGFGRLGSKFGCSVGTVGMLIWMINSFALLLQSQCEVIHRSVHRSKKIGTRQPSIINITTIAINSCILLPFSSSSLLSLYSFFSDWMPDIYGGKLFDYLKMSPSASPSSS